MKQLTFDFLDIRIGDEVQYNDGAAEVLNVEKDQVELMGYGWVDKSKVYLDINWSEVQYNFTFQHFA